MYYIHGGAGRGRITPEYSSWQHMKARCLDKSNRAYSWYGGRGIAIYPAWINDFAAFLAYMGPCPTLAHTIDRYPDGNGNYEPGNVRWSTKREQARNRSAVTLTAADALVIFTSTVPTHRLAAEYGINPATITDIRKRRSWTDVTDGLPDAIYAKDRQARRSSLSVEDAINIFTSHKSEIDLAAEYGVGSSTINRIRKRQRWQSVTAGLPEPSYARKSRTGNIIGAQA